MHPNQHEDLHVVTCISNPVGWKSRLALAEYAISKWLAQGAKVTLVECAYGSRGFDLADIPGIHHVGVRATSMAWNKESLINIGIARLPSSAQKIAVLDADVEFRSPNWVNDTLHALDLYPVIQPWAVCYDLGPGDTHMQVHHSFASQWHSGKPVVRKHGNWWTWEGGPYAFPHTGYAWAYQRHFLDLIGGLMDWAGMGSADHHMAHAFIGAADQSLPGNTNPNYREALMEWQRRAKQHMNGKMGFLTGTIEHPYHGSKEKRKYKDRWTMFCEHQFDPYHDIKKNTHGVVEFSGNKPELEREFDNYLRSRSEDANT